MSNKSKKDTKAIIVKNALALAAQMGWAQVRLTDIAREADISLPDLFDVVEYKSDILVLLGRQIDRQVLLGMGTTDDGAAVRDQLFDILMDRYEILNEYRDGLIAILESFKFDPKQAVIACPHLCRSMTWMLEAAGIDTGGVRGALKIAGLTGLYLKTLRVWRDDDSADLAKVMAALDKDLTRIESAANTFGF